MVTLNTVKNASLDGVQSVLIEVCVISSSLTFTKKTWCVCMILKCKVDILSNFWNMYLKYVEHNLNLHNFRLYFCISIMFWDILRCGSQILPMYQRYYSDRLD